MRWAITVGLAIVVAGCVGPTPSARTTDAASDMRNPTFMTHVRVQAVPLTELDNSQLQLPVVSPDGRWVASLAVTGGPVDPQTLFTGRGASGVSLSVRLVQGSSPAVVVCPAGALWPTWSADGHHLAFITYNDTRRAEVAIYNVQTHQTVRRSLPMRQAFMPALSADGSKVAFVAPTAEDGQTRVHVMDVASGAVTSCPPDEATVRQLCPQWTPDGRVVFVLAEVDRTYLAQWGPGRFEPEKLATIPFDPSDLGAYQATAALPRPLSRDGRRFAFYDVTNDTITIVKLADGSRSHLPPGTRAGCWFGARRFVGATGDRMSLYGDPAKPPALLMDGPWLPRAAAGGTLIALTQGTHRRAFGLVRLNVTME